MKTYQHYSPEELALDGSFRRWILHGNETDSAFWQDWLLKNPDKQGEVATARQLVIAMRQTPFRDISDAQVSRDITRVLETVVTRVEAPPGNRRHFIFPVSTWKVAAILVLISSAGWWIGRHGFKEILSGHPQETLSATDETRKDFINSTSITQKFALPDHSTVTLAPGTTLGYLENAAGERITELDGDAFFEVRPDPRRPFLVFNNNVITKVLGTSFRIRSWAGSNAVQVTVHTGKVSVFSRKEWDAGKTTPSSGLILTANQGADFVAANGTFHKYVVRNPLKVQPVPEQQFEFSSTPVVEIFDLIEKTYGIELVYDRQLLQDCALTASLSDEPLLEKIQLICQGINATYQETDARIVIHSKGCH